jgi:hypothetical protein
MMRVVTSMGILFVLTVCSEATTSVKPSSNPYRAIVERNVFGLESPILPATNQPVKVELPPITLTGVTTILGKKQALITVAPPAIKTLQYYILGEGDRDDDIGVVEIDMKAGTVQLDYDGLRITLTLTKLHPVSSSLSNSPRPK